MHQRAEAPKAFDDFPTPPWATRAAIEILRKRFGCDLSKMTAREPCANRGHMVRPLEETFSRVIASDIYDYGAGYKVLDYLFPGQMEPADVPFFNPPFNLAIDFILKSFETPGWWATVAIVRTGFLESIRRYQRLFRIHPPTLIAQHVERVIMHKGIVRDPGKKHWNGSQWRKPSTATSYCWLFFVKGISPQPFHWIPPCRKRLEQPGDYDNDDANRR
jgi:hypothetical protein